eukprot:gene2864-5700_t
MPVLQLRAVSLMLLPQSRQAGRQADVVEVAEVEVKVAEVEVKVGRRGRGRRGRGE